MASVVHLVRHGEVENPDEIVYADLPGFHLSGRGRDQAAWAGERLARRPIRAVYTSPLDRARTTAEAITVPHGLSAVTIPELTEWALLSRWRGLPWEDLDSHFPGELGAYLAEPLRMDFTPETLKELAQRAGGMIAVLAGRHPGQEIVVVSHQDPIQAARLDLTGRPLHLLHDDMPRHCEVITLAWSERWTETGRRSPDL